MLSVYPVLTPACRLPGATQPTSRGIRLPLLLLMPLWSCRSWVNASTSNVNKACCFLSGRAACSPPLPSPPFALNSEPVQLLSPVETVRGPGDSVLLVHHCLRRGYALRDKPAAVQRAFGSTGTSFQVKHRKRSEDNQRGLLHLN